MPTWLKRQLRAIAVEKLFSGAGAPAVHPVGGATVYKYIYVFLSFFFFFSPVHNQIKTLRFTARFSSNEQLRSRYFNIGGLFIQWRGSLCQSYGSCRHFNIIIITILSPCIINRLLSLSVHFPYFDLADTAPLWYFTILLRWKFSL